MLTRLNKAIAATGLYSRRKADELILSGKVKVNGACVNEPFFRVDVGKDAIAIEGHKKVKPQSKYYFLLNKPRGYVCSNVRQNLEHLVIDLFPQHLQNLFTVGRLDRESTGLLIVTNDGDFANKVIHPSSNISKEYLVKVNQEIFDDHLLAIGKGGFIEGSFVKPFSVKKLRKGTIKITLKQGKKREIRVLCEKAGLDVVELKRIRIGALHLGNLPAGSYRNLSEKERLAIFE